MLHLKVTNGNWQITDQLHYYQKSPEIMHTARLMLGGDGKHILMCFYFLKNHNCKTGTCNLVASAMGWG